MTAELRSFLARLGVALVCGLILSPVAALVFSETPFHRVMIRTFMAGILIAFAWGRGSPRNWVGSLRGMGMHGPDRALRILFGIHIALLVVFLILMVSVLLDGRPWLEGPFRKEFWSHLGGALLAAALVPLLEEPLFRGYFKNIMGGPLSALVYSLVHFFRPLHGSAPAGPDFDPLLAFKRFPELLEGWTVPRHITFGALSLFLFGLALNRMRERTGSIYVCIGIHSGIVFALSFYARFVREGPSGSEWIYGGGRLYDGVIGSVALALLLWASYKAPIPERLTRRP